MTRFQLGQRVTITTLKTVGTVESLTETRHCEPIYYVIYPDPLVKDGEMAGAFFDEDKLEEVGA